MLEIDNVVYTNISISYVNWTVIYKSAIHKLSTIHLVSLNELNRTKFGFM